ncbi:pyridoxamine 5'-phosphate oxidase family protein [Lolliginicoccus levis]|uniref:pyridoxamine 5'-phosphate oxidase family protein n=1 Tax=Lolliginicoccus levis TaxID=2919542 RepID=UPI00241E4AB0|nr:pyridoxamine 5'-phosphate oxidase family protein [Lolliginicoccus levis]
MINNRYHHLVLGEHALERQHRSGSYVAYGTHLERPDDGPQDLGDRELAFLARAFQFHLATITPAGWPYLQYRSGPRGFLQHLGGNRIGFADLRGNAQYASVGNIEHNGRVALILIDHPRRQRLKLLGTATVIDRDTDPDLLERLVTIGTTRMTAQAERSIILDIEARDWNCARSIVPLYDRDYISELSGLYQAQIVELRSEVQQLRAEIERLRAG